MTSTPPAQMEASPPSHNLQVLATRNFLVGLRMNMMRAIWQPFVLHLGASMSLLGLLESIGGFGGIVSAATLPVGGWLSDRRGRKPFVILANVFAFASLCIFVLAAWLREWRLLLPGVVLSGLTAIARPVADAMIAESATPSARGRAFSLVGMAFAASGVFAPALGGLLAERYGFLATLLLGAVLEVFTLGLLVTRLRETLATNGGTAAASDFFGLLRGILTPPAGLRSFYVAVTIDMFAYGTGAAILPGLLTEAYDFTPFQLGFMSSITAAAWAISQMFFGRKVDRHGCVPFLILSEVLGVLVTGGWLAARSFEAFAVLGILNGLVPATWVPAFLAWIANSVPENQRAEEIGRLGAFRGLLSFPAPYVGGLLYEAVGFKGPILANLIGAAMVAVLLWLLVGEPRSCGVEPGEQ